MSAKEIFYFGAGPATLPRTVLETIQNELIDFQSTGLSVLELSHRSDEFAEIIEQAERLLREEMVIPDDYAVLFMHGGATAQYSMLPHFFLSKGDVADYVCSGYWSTRASQEAKQFAAINELHVLEEDKEVSILPIEFWDLNDDAVYLHYCENETITGVVFEDVLKFQDKNVFCDMTSSILTKSIRIQEYDLIYASAQKNLGIAGLNITIIKKSLLSKIKSNVPRMFNYEFCYERNSLVNTPPTFAIYVLGLMMKWFKAQGGVNHFSKIRQYYASKFYDLIDNSGLFINKIAKKNRSLINISFDFDNQELLEKFLLQAERHNLLGLRGHKSAGGIRISLYNAMPEAGMKHLLEFMHNFHHHR